MKEILICVINYKCEEEVLKYALDLSKQNDKDKCFLAVVVNKYSDGANINSFDKLSEYNIDYAIYDSGENLGYFNGILYGVEMFKKEFNYVPKWFVVSNTDIVIKDNSFYQKFLSTRYDEDIWCVCPSVLSADLQSYCNPHYKNRIPLNKVNRIIRVFNSQFLTWIYCKTRAVLSKKKKRDKEPSQFVYSAHGCYFILKSDFYDNLRGEKYGAFLYSEESYVAEHILKAGKTVFYDSNIELIHNENLSTGKLSDRTVNKMISNSMKYIRDKFYHT